MGFAQPGAHRLFLAEVAAQAQRADPGVERAQLPQDEGRAVDAAVVDVDDLEPAGRFLDRRDQAPVKLREHGFLVAHRHDHAQRAGARRAHGGMRRRKHGAHAKLQRRFMTKPPHTTIEVAKTWAAR